MRILHVCLANFYIDNYGYQENIITKMHKLQGHDVFIIASTETYVDNKKIGYVEAQDYISNDGIPVKRIAYSRFFPAKIVRKLRIYKGLYKELVGLSPDIIFIHGSQFLSILMILKYVKKNKNIKVFVDGHTDFINSARNWVSKYILHKVIYRWCSKKIEPYVEMYWATLPIRLKFMKEIYGVPSNKIRLLELGADDTLFEVSNKNNIRKKVRDELGLSHEEFLIVTGGRIDRRKNIHILIDAMKLMERNNVRLIVFGTPDEDMDYLVDKIKQSPNIIYLGWKKQEEIYNFLQASDLGIYPGTHSVLWEQSCGVGLPCIFKEWDNIQHVDLGGNCIFLTDITDKSLANAVVDLIDNNWKYKEMLFNAEEKCINHFSYSNIAKRAILA